MKTSEDQCSRGSGAAVCASLSGRRIWAIWNEDGTEVHSFHLDEREALREMETLRQNYDELFHLEWYSSSAQHDALKTELIHVAAILVRFTVPVFSDHLDWCKTTPAKERARIIEEFQRVDGLLKGIAVRLRKCADSVKTNSK